MLHNHNDKKWPNTLTSEHIIIFFSYSHILSLLTLSSFWVERQERSEISFKNGLYYFPSAWKQQPIFQCPGLHSRNQKDQNNPSYPTIWYIHMQELHAEKRSGWQKNPYIQPWIWGPGYRRYWPSSSDWPHRDLWAAAESSSTRSPWSHQSYTSNHCGRRLSAACVSCACGPGPWPNWARESDEVRGLRDLLWCARSLLLMCFSL